MATLEDQELKDNVEVMRNLQDIILELKVPKSSNISMHLFVRSVQSSTVNLNVHNIQISWVTVCFCFFLRMRVQASPLQLMPWLQERIYQRCQRAVAKTEQMTPHQYVNIYVLTVITTSHDTSLVLKHNTVLYIPSSLINCSHQLIEE